MSDQKPTISLSSSAIKQVKFLLGKENKPQHMLRLRVDSGGCSGFQYMFKLDDVQEEDDLTFDFDGVTLVIDELSLSILDGSEVDYVEELIGAAFVVKNPNAAASCGCGTSFSVK